MKKHPLLVFGLLSLVIGAVALVIILATRVSTETKREIDEVTIQKDGNTLVISRDGRVVYRTEDGEFVDFWDAEKTAFFFSYIGDNYAGEGDLVTGGGNYIVVSSGGGTTVYVLGSDELIDAVEDDTSGGGGPGGGGGGPGGGPTPTSSSQGQGGGGPDPECLYWRLSYCVRPRTPSPIPSATPTVAEIREPDCEANTQTGRTVIGNDLCLPTPSPTP